MTRYTYYLFILLLYFKLAPVFGGCPFQNPFWFLDRPSAVTVNDEEGEIVPDKVRVSWGQLENFKCVDYFQIEYYEKGNMSSVQHTGKINRHRRSHDIDIKPCLEYIFKVIASEDWQGMREDFKMASDLVSFQVDYNPRFMKPPTVKEIKIRPPRPGRGQSAAYAPRKRREPLLDEVGQTPTLPPDPEPDLPFKISVSWRIKDIDWPSCLDHFEFDYYDIVYNESVHMEIFRPPFEPRMEFTLPSEEIPCSEDFAFIVRVFGLTGGESRNIWTPPRCVIETTTSLSTTSTTESTTVSDQDEAFDEAWYENEALKEKINGLKQQYGPIGQQVYDALKENIYLGLEGFLARKKIIETGDIEQMQLLDPNAPF